MHPQALSEPKKYIEVTRRHKKRNEDQVQHQAETDEVTEGEPSTPKYYRQREHSHKSRQSKKRSYFKRAPTLVDARGEHLLLAARRIGELL